jgi:hypothetical protein
MITLHALPVPILDGRLALREELGRLDRLRDHVATQLTIENFKHYIKTSPPAEAFALIDRPVDPPVRRSVYDGRFAGQGAHEGALGPQPGRPRRFTAAELAAAYDRTPPPRTGPRIAATLGLRVLTFYNQMYSRHLTLRQLRAGGHV